MTSRLAAHHDQIREWVEGGVSRAEVARRLGVETSVARRYINRYIKGNETPVLSVPDGDVTREEILSAEVGELRKRLASGRKADVAQERILAAVEAAVVRTEPGPEFFNSPISEVGGSLDTAHHRVLLQLSDFHSGEYVDPDQVNGVNAYSWEIMEQRVDELIRSVLSHKRYLPPLTGLDIVFGGDMCSGSNHAELAETNEYVLAEQGVRMGYVQAKIVSTLAPHFPEVDVVAVPGNHPRLTMKPAAKNVHNNMDWVAATITREAVRGFDNVTVNCPLGNATFHEIAGRTLYIMHGDGIRSTMPGVPWGGVMRRINAIQAQHRNRPIDHFLVHHFHQPNIVQGGRILMNGSLKGPDEWCLKQFGEASPPHQWLHVFDEAKSRLVDNKHITPTAGIPTC